MSTTERRIAIAKDVATFVVGIGGIVWQQLTNDVNFVLLGVFTLMASVPGLTNLPTLVRVFNTPSLQSPSVSQESSTDSSHSSNGDAP